MNNPEMDSPDLITNVLNLEEGRAKRAKKAEQVANEQLDSGSEEERCVDGVCSLNWRPKKKSEAAA